MSEHASEQRKPRLQWDDLVSSEVAGHRTALASRKGASWQELDYADLRRRVESLSSLLALRGIDKGERIAILAESGPQWVVAFLSILRTGAVAVPLDIKLTQEELLPILNNCAPRLLVASTPCLSTAHELKPQVPSLEEVVLLEEAIPEHSRVSSPVQACEPDETAVITYTSGTTGSPQVVMTTWGSLLFQVQATQGLFHGKPRDVCLSILPLNHLLELTGGLLSALHAGAQVCYANTLYPQELVYAMQERRPTRMVVVPLFLKLLRETIQKDVQRSGILRRALFKAMLIMARGLPSRGLRRLLFRPVHRQFGGRLTEFICGGAPLDTRVAHFFQRLGFSVYQGYGLTETGPVVSVNTPHHNKIGSVGLPLPGVSVRILRSGPHVSDGEILTQGPHIMKGYFRRDDLTKEVIDAEGWLHTGDLGHIDTAGYLHITGRLKDLIVLGNWKKVHPEEVEDVLCRGASVKEVSVLGRLAHNGLHEDTEEVWAVGVPQDGLGEDHHATEQIVRREVEQLSRALAPFKRPARVAVRLEDLPRTTTRKIRRPMIQQWLDSQEGDIS